MYPLASEYMGDGRELTCEVFVSYAHDDRSRVKDIVSVLEKQGWDVWWDRDGMLPGEDPSKVVEKVLDGAACVVCMWTRRSIESLWVKSEATSGHRRGILIPICLDPIEPPRPFNVLSTADLTGWPGSQDDAEFRRMVTAIAQVVGPREDGAVAAVARVLRQMQHSVERHGGWKSTNDSLYGAAFIGARLGVHDARRVVDALLRCLAGCPKYKLQVPALLVLLGFLAMHLDSEPGPGVTEEQVNRNIDCLQRLASVEIWPHRETVLLLNSVASDCWA